MTGIRLWSVAFACCCLLAPKAFADIVNTAGMAGRVETQFQCKTDNDGLAYHQELIGTINLFIDHCGGLGIVGVQQPNQLWAFRNCGPIADLTPPEIPQLASEHAAQVIQERTQWVSQDVCNIWKPVPWSAQLQKLITASKQTTTKADQKAVDQQLAISVAQQTGCNVVSILMHGNPFQTSTVASGQPNTQASINSLEAQLLCPGNVAKVIYRENVTDPLKVHTCISPTEEICFHGPRGSQICSLACDYMKK